MRHYVAHDLNIVLLILFLHVIPLLQTCVEVFFIVSFSSYGGCLKTAAFFVFVKGNSWA